MSLPHASGHDDELLTRYVLGLLPEEESERLDEASIADDEVAARLRIVENDLIEGYVRGTLDGETRRRFESYYLSSRRRRESVRSAGSFLRAVDRAAERADAEPGADSTSGVKGERGEDAASKPRSHEPMAVRSKLVASLAAVAALLLLASGALLFEAVRTVERLNVAQAENVALDRRARDLERQLEAQRAASAATVKEREPVGLSDRAGAVRALRTIALVLLPQTRSIGPIPTIAIPAGTDRIALELRLESNDFPRYRIGLQDPATNEIVWRSGWTTVKTSGDRLSISVLIPASVLKTQHYSLQLTGGGTAGSDDIVGSYAFRIVPQ
jgi:anti-sigma-K factor RskA